MSDVTAGTLFNPQFFMNPPWWVGRVEQKETWDDNIEGETFTSLTDIEGWGHRYKVRIFNWHTGDLDTLPPRDMAFCQVIMPVTAGSGHGGSTNTPSIESGSVVFGFFMDGMPGQEGYIMGVLGNSNNNVPRERGEAAPNQSSSSPGETGNCNLGYQQFGDTYTDGNEMRAAKVPDDRTVASTPLSITEAQHIRNVATEAQDQDMRRKVPLLSVCRDDESELSGIQLVMQNLLNDIESLKRLFNQVSAFSAGVQAYTDQVRAKVDLAIEEISGYLKNLINRIRGSVTVELNRMIDLITPRLFPTLIPDLYVIVEQGLGIINCLFNAFIDGLIALLVNLLTNILDNFINAPLCAARNLVTNFIGNILGPIASTLQSVIAPINALVGGVTAVLGSFSSVIDLITGILQFFLCDPSPDCIQYTEISQDGPAIPQFNFNLPTLPNTGNQSSSQCQTGPVIGGPPFVGVFGQTAPGSTAPVINPIISPISSSVIAFDIINPGSGFLGTPTAVLVDPLGNGNGANLQVNLEDGEPSETTVTSGGTGGTPVTSDGTVVIAGGTGGTPLTAGGTGGTPVTAGGIVLTAGGTPVTAGGTGGTPVTAGGTPVTAGGTGGTPVTAGGTGGTPVTADGTSVIAGGTPTTAGETFPTAGTGGAGVTEETSVTSRRTPVTGPGSLADVPLSDIPNLEQLSTRQLIKLLDPSRTPSANQSKAASEARQKARSQGLPSSEVTRLGLVASVKASRQSGSTGRTTLPTKGSPLTFDGTLGKGLDGKDPCDAPRELFEKVTINKLSTTKKIKNITIIAPGNGYLAAPNGSLGGGGRVWKEPDEGYVRTKCGGYYVVQPYRPIEVKVGDTYYPPDGPPVLIEEDQFINLPLVPIDVPKPETFGLTYQVILCIEEIKVIDKGFGYRPGDKLIITPDNGTQTELVINQFGNVDSVKILQSGCGFLDFPEMRTNSKTGFNATFTPIFKVTKLDDFNRNNEVISKNIPSISVVDCVGKISPKSSFDMIIR